MSSSFYEIVNRANQIASGRGTDANNSPVIDSEMTTEALYDHALRFVASDILKKGDRIRELSKIQTISFTAGVGAFPDGALTQAVKKYASMPERDFASYQIPEDYRRARFTALLDYFTVEDDSVYYKQSGTPSYTGDAVFSFITLPEKDFTAVGFTKEIDLPESVLDDVVLVMAGALTGEIGLDTLMNNGIY